MTDRSWITNVISLSVSPQFTVSDRSCLSTRLRFLLTCLILATGPPTFDDISILSIGIFGPFPQLTRTHPITLFSTSSTPCPSSSPMPRTQDRCSDDLFLTRTLQISLFVSAYYWTRMVSFWNVSVERLSSVPILPPLPVQYSHAFT